MKWGQSNLSRISVKNRQDRPAFSFYKNCRLRPFFKKGSGIALLYNLVSKILMPVIHLCGHIFLSPFYATIELEQRC